MQVAQGTLIHGIAASEHLDSSGERISIQGLDISSLERGEGVLNFEHKSDTPAQVVGKIVFAKKIFKAEDCDDMNQMRFWNKSGAPFLYIIGELFDGVGHETAKSVVAMLRYDAKAQEAKANVKNIVNFSVEGSKLDKQGSDINRAIARKVSITITPCNKMAIAEEYQPEQAVQAKEKPLLDGIFKSEEGGVEILEKASPPSFGGASRPKFTASAPAPKPAAPAPVAAPKPAAAPAPTPPAANLGSMIGRTKSGKDVFSHASTSAYGKDFGMQDHHDAGSLHYDAAQKAKDPATAKHHMKQMQFHFAARDRAEKIGQIKEAQRQKGKAAAQKVGEARAQNIKQILGKTLTAGGGDVAPANRTGMFALSKESLDGAAKMWPLYGEAVKFLSKKIPSLDKSEAESLAKYMALRAMERAETALAKMSDEGLEKSKNVREQRRKIFGTDPNAPRLSDKRRKMMQYIKQYVENKYGMNLQTAQGKRDTEGRLREEADLAHEPYDVFTPEGQQEEKARLAQLKEQGVKRTDPKPHWVGDTLETQPSPDAAVHEVAHLDLAPEGVTPEQFQLDMDQAYARHGKEYGHAQGKRTAWEVQPMSVENPIRREIGLPSNRATKKPLTVDEISQLNARRAKKGLPPLETDPETGVELTFDDKRPRFHRGTDDKHYDRQSRLQSPETQERMKQIKEGSLKFDPQRGWYRADDTNALINLRGRGQQEEAALRARRRFANEDDEKLAASEEDKKDSPDIEGLPKLSKPYASEAQRRWAHTPAGTRALGGKKAVRHWDVASRGKDLPEKVEKVESDMEKKSKPFHGYNPKKHSRTGGLSDSYRKKYNRETGSKLKRPVTGKVKAGSKAANRRKSFCARMKGVKGPTSKEGKLTPKGAALKRWKCS